MSEQESDILARLRAANPALVEEDRGRGAVAQAALQRILEDPAALAAPEPDERAARRPRSRPRQIWRRPRGAARATVAAVPVLVTIIVTVVVAAIALTSLRHHHSSVRHHHGSTAVAPTVPRIAAKNGEIALDLSGQPASGHAAVEDRLELVNPDGSGRRYVAAYPCPRSAPICDVWAFAWSPGGTQLAYLAGDNTVTGPNEYTLYLVGANGQQPRPLTACVSCEGVSWSPDGSQIAVGRNNGRGVNVWVVNARTGAMRPVIDCPSAAMCGDDPQWSPSGRSILFMGSRKELGPESGYVWSLDTIDPDGSQLTKITGIPDAAEHPQWSPDEREIAFEYNNGIYTVNADGTHLRRLVAQGGNPAWSPDGTELVYSTWPAGKTGAHTQLWTINANGSDNRLLYASGSDNRLLASSGNFGAQMWSPLIWSPDGKQIAFSAQHGTYLINTDGTGLHRIGPSTGELAWQPIP